jgi:hypothetical protein
MKHEELVQILNRLNKLPRKMLRLQEYDNVTEFVLHELCNKQCFDIGKAAYFVDNPDFNLLKGVAGYYQPEAYAGDDMWEQPSKFSAHMQGASFNQKVRRFHHGSMRKNKQSDDAIVQLISQEVGLKDPRYYSWDMKHGNHGLFVYEKSCDGEGCVDYVQEGLCLLGFCPVF